MACVRSFGGVGIKTPAPLLLSHGKAYGGREVPPPRLDR